MWILVMMIICYVQVEGKFASRYLLQGAMMGEEYESSL